MDNEPLSERLAKINLPPAPRVLQRTPRNRRNRYLDSSDEETPEGYSETRGSLHSLAVRRGSRGSTVYTDNSDQSNQSYYSLWSSNDSESTLVRLFETLDINLPQTQNTENTDDDEMDKHIPRFAGYTEEESILQFIDQFELYTAIKGMADDRKIAVLRLCLYGPARTTFDASVAGNALAGATPAAQWEDAKARLRTIYHTADVQQTVKDQLAATYQGINESPLTYYQHIRHMIDVAEYPAALQAQMAEITFMNGLHQEIALQVRSTPTPLTLEGKVSFANRYWSARNPTANVMQRILPESLRRNPMQQQPTVARTGNDYSSQRVMPPTVDWSKQGRQPDPRVDALTKAVEELTINIAQMKSEGRQPRYRSYDTRDTRATPASGANRVPVVCYNCKEEGHFARDYQSESTRQAQPSNATKKQDDARHVSIHMAGRYQEVFTSEDDEEFIAPAAIAKRKPGRPPKNQAEPYPKRILTRNKEKQPEVVYEVPKFRDKDLQEEIERVLQGEDPEPQDIPMSESKKERKLKVKKQYEYNVWDDIKSRPANINIKQLAEMNPHIRQQIREGISNIQTKTEVVEARKASDSESSSGDEKHTSAYAECVIEGRTFKAVIDTGAGPNLIAKHTLDELGWGIEEPTKMTINTAMGEKSTPLGKVKDISVQVGGATIPVRSMIVTSAKSYDLILGNEWINKANANINIPKGHMTIEWKGKKWRVPISSRAPKFKQVEASDSEQEAFMVTTEKKKKTRKRYNPRRKQEIKQCQEAKPYG